MPPKVAYPTAGKASSRIRQACDVCHTRKIRCDGRRPCMNCRLARVDCTYNAVPKKTGPKGPRLKPASWSETEVEFRPSPLVSADLFRRYLDVYFIRKYPITPILDRNCMEECVSTYSESPEKYGLLTSCCATIALDSEVLLQKFEPTPAHLLSSAQPSVILPTPEFFVQETLRARRHIHLAESLSLTHIYTSFFLSHAFFCLNNGNAAWVYLRESVTILQTLRLHEEATYSETRNQTVATYSRRMFWTLFVTERSFTIQRERPLTLLPTINLPKVDPLSPDAEILAGFLDLVSLFLPFDFDFITTMNLPISPALKTTKATQFRRLQDKLSNCLAKISHYPEAQQADLLVTREWLKIIVWKICVSKSLLSSSTNSRDSMSLSYPSSIARETVLISRLLPSKAFEANGVAILEKVFDVGCSLADVLSLNPHPPSSVWSAMDVGPIDVLVEIVRIAGTKFGDGYQHLRILVDKTYRCVLMNVDRSLPLPTNASRVQAEEID
ncbi:putative sucrose utilization protein SUC1 [Colletotrichum asianum]|uniref:Putative sucrose utilization protein SUC1 n=1 Tax=Colletotrichum asianum TaxID=702518 RepID=A0A8H3WPP0_9PEZI|nr:putative sucrose utilization protein SUC1 [Colletotrichum asianum]